MGGFACPSPPSSEHEQPTVVLRAVLRVPPSVDNAALWRRNINLLSIAYAFRPRLRAG
jgi:hypothetical protein